ncbi:MAG: TonB-dependent receptor [Gemmatimonadetes bacterium]|nr:TonB-dependent receptor [Gemmatimonadota bacterium]
MSETWFRRGLACLTSLIALVVIAAPAAAQGGTVHVSVIDRTNSQTINGARVVLLNTRLTGVTDGRGELNLLNVPPGTYTVQVLSIGYRSATQTVTVTLGGTANLSFELGLSAVSLDEIVVTGTGGAVERKKLGTTLGVVNVSRVQDLVDVAEFGSVLRARIPGVRSVNGAGGVGGSKNLLIRGISSFSMDQRPVVYIDGVRLDTQRGVSGAASGTACCSFDGGVGGDRLNDLNPDDIERIEVIKGAAATTLYGTEATNGVIQIFTKQGRANSAPRWTASYGAGFKRLRNNLATTQKPRFFGPDGTQARSAGELIENGLIQRGDVTVQGGGESVTYFFSGGLAYEEGSIKPNDMTRGNVRLNLNWTASDNWNFEMQTAFTKANGQLLQTGNNWTALLGNALIGNPLAATAERPWGEPWTAISDIKDIQSTSNVQRWTGGLTANFNPNESFGHRLTVGLDQTTDRLEKLFPFGQQYVFVGNDGERGIGFRNFQSFTLDYLGTLAFNIGGNVQSDFSFGAQGFFEEDRTNSAIGEGFAGTGVTTVTGAAVRQGRESFREEINVGLFAQNRFSISDRLFATVGARLDGNSAFGEDFGLQFYPKAELAYLVLEQGSGTISTLKLRGAVGMSGLAPGAFDQFRTFSPTSRLEGQPGVTPNNPGNTDLEPEKTTEFEGGFDAGLFNDRVSIEATAYYAKTRDAILGVELPPSMGFPSDQRRNIGALENKGWELKFDAAIIENAGFRWSTGINMSGNTNEITDLGEFASDCNAERTQCRLGNSRLGFPIGADFSRVITGYDAATNTHTRSDTSEFVGLPNPTWTGSLTQTVEYGAFRLYGMLTWETGHVAANSGRSYQVRQLASDELLIHVNDDGTYTRQADSVLDKNRLVTPFDKRDHLRIQEVSLNYQFPASFTSKLGLGRTTLALSGQNLMWWDDCNCLDPTSTTYGGAAFRGGETSNSLFLAVPVPRTFIFSIRTTF